MTDSMFPLPINIGHRQWWIPGDVTRYLRHRHTRARVEVWEPVRGDELRPGNVIRDGAALWYVKRRERDPTVPDDWLVQVSRRKGSKSGPWRRVRAGRTVERLREAGESQARNS